MGKQATKGFSLVEVLVSLCILSVGVIGAAAMQLSAVRSTQQSGFHNSALQLATDLADLIRNSGSTSLGAATNPLLSLDFNSSEPTVAPSALCWSAPAGCDAANMASFAAYEVQRRLATTLPQGRVKICRDAAPWDGKSRTYRWDCDDAGSNAPLVVKVGWRDPGQVKSGALKQTTVPQFVLLVQS